MLDRRRIVDRHHPIITGLEPNAPLSLGNGEFGFSADFTGLQTFPEYYTSPLGTQSNWGWHYTGGPEVFTDEDIVYQSYETYGRKVAYPLLPEDREEAYHWLRQNPHRLQLGRIAFRIVGEDGHEVKPEEITAIKQRLDLWTGILSSEFIAEGEKVTVQTACHPERDTVSVSVRSNLLKRKKLQVFIRFPSPDMSSREWDQTVFPIFENDDRHSTSVEYITENSVVLHRRMDQDGYAVRWDWNAGQFLQTNTHEFTLTADESSEELSFAVTFAPEVSDAITADEVVQASRTHWESFWMSGAAVDFEGSTDPRANELERRIVLSQYLTAVHCSGSLPPQETGYMYNSWFGKFHLEMHWWHAAHFPLWGRADLLANSMDWYLQILPEAKRLAASQGYRGARWPKMVGFDGKQSPSNIATGLIWQQPHPIALAELLYRAEPNEEILERYWRIISESADFMVSYAHWDEARKAYVLGPPLIPSQECHAMEDSMNPPYELEYWKYGLEIAVDWARRLNKPHNPQWSEVASAMAKPPQAEGVYLAHENCPNTYTEKNHDHPSMVAAYGMLPGTLVDPEVMRRTLFKIKEAWIWETTWGWDYPMCAMAAARLGEYELAIDFLLMNVTKNTYLPNGHNYQRPGLTSYLPGNGGLLMAVAMMLSGWRGSEFKDGPGLPREGWKVKWEGLQPLL